MPKKVIKLDLSDEEVEIVVVKKKEKKIIEIDPDFDVDAIDYYYKSWPQKFTKGKIKLLRLIKNDSWQDFFDSIKDTKNFKNIEKIIESMIINNPDKIIVPYPRLLFHPMNILSPDKIRVVILGQDPYIGSQSFDDITVPQAIGVSFSAPKNYPKPKSLLNIYANLNKYNHINCIPDHGYLISWVVQGVFMFNTTLTTFLGTSNAHKNLWNVFTEELIKYINNNCRNIVFLLWGANAANQEKLISTKHNKVIISSHPSPFSFTNTLTTVINNRKIIHNSFFDTDHFGETNKYFKKLGLEEINWNSINS